MDAITGQHKSMDCYYLKNNNKMFNVLLFAISSKEKVLQLEELDLCKNKVLRSRLAILEEKIKQLKYIKTQ